VSLDKFLSSGKDLRSSQDIFHDINEPFLNEIITRFLECNLNEREMFIIECHFGIHPETLKPMPMYKIAKCLNISRERARQIYERALEKLRIPSEFTQELLLNLP